MCYHFSVGFGGSIKTNNTASQLKMILPNIQPGTYRFLSSAPFALKRMGRTHIIMKNKNALMILYFFSYEQIYREVRPHSPRTLIQSIS